ncbi:MAG: hypothetical protein MNPFHGCM_00733 [Gemmatimonadaceae bacterium]|nr:hypothetical protein [Gemmatimonadaceae bacterium]
MTDFRVGAIDVYLLNLHDDPWDVLVLRRAAGVRCAGAWEAVHGRIEPGETPPEAAIREIAEETGMKVDRLYNVGCQAFYLHRPDVVLMSVSFAALVGRSTPILGPEHDRFEWLPFEIAMERIAWPRSRQALSEIRVLLRGGDAGAVEDVLRVL